MDCTLQIAWQEVVFRQHPVLHGLVPALDLTLGLRVHRFAACMSQAPLADLAGRPARTRPAARWDRCGRGALLFRIKRFPECQGTLVFGQRIGIGIEDAQRATGVAAIGRERLFRRQGTGLGLGVRHQIKALVESGNACKGQAAAPFYRAPDRPGQRSKLRPEARCTRKQRGRRLRKPWPPVHCQSGKRPSRLSFINFPVEVCAR